MRLELTRVGLLVELANHYTTTIALGRKPSVCKLILTLASNPPNDSNCDWNWTAHPSGLWHLIILLFDTHLLPVAVRICTEFNHVSMSRWYSDIFNSMHLFRFLPFIYTGASLDWRLGRASICYTLVTEKYHLLYYLCFNVPLDRYQKQGDIH